MRFEDWLADLFQKDESELRPLLEDQAAFRFLIVWSLFEAKCFDGFMKVSHLDKFARRLVTEGYDVEQLAGPIASFHARYQDTRLYSNLMHRRSSSRMEHVLRLNVAEMDAEDKIFLLAVVIYRYRNNMFHGNKGVRSWLRFQDQIHSCTQVMQSFITHVETIAPTLPERQAA